MTVSDQAKPRLAICNPYTWPHVRRGSERMLNDLSHYLKDQGYAVEVYAMAPNARRWEQDGISYIYLQQKYSSPFREFTNCHYFAVQGHSNGSH